MTDAAPAVHERSWTAAARLFLARVRPLHFVPVLAVIALGAWVFASPIGSAPDDDFHLTSTWCANPLRTDLCEAGPSAAERVVPPAVINAPCYAYNEEATAQCQVRFLKESQAPSVVTGRGNFQSNYPPVFYAVMNVLAGPNLLVSGILMRLLNVLLFVGVSTALYCLLPAARKNTLVWGWLITLVPLGLFLIASNNPSSWAVIGIGSSWLALVGYFESTGSRRIALGALFGVTTLMAAGARGDAALYSIIGAGIACVLTWRNERRWWLQAILPAVLAVAAVLFFVSSRATGVATEGLGGAASSDVPLSGIGLLFYNLLNVPELWAGVFGGWPLGWLDTDLPAVVAFGGVGVFAAVAFAGFGLMSWRKVIMAFALVLVLWLLPTYVLDAGGNAVGENVQPRYLLPLIIILGGLAMLSVDGRRVRLGRVQTTIIAVALIIAQAFALHIDIRRYVTGTDLQSGNLDDSVEWWWSGMLSPMTTWALGSLAFAGLIIILLRELRRPHELAG